GERGREAGEVGDVGLRRTRELGELHGRGGVDRPLRLALGRDVARDLLGDLPVDRPRGRQHPHELRQVEVAETGHARHAAGEAGKSGEPEAERRLAVVVVGAGALGGVGHGVSLRTCPRGPTRHLRASRRTRHRAPGDARTGAQAGVRGAGSARPCSTIHSSQSGVKYLTRVFLYSFTDHRRAYSSTPVSAWIAAIVCSHSRAFLPWTIVNTE